MMICAVRVSLGLLLVVWMCNLPDPPDGHPIDTATTRATPSVQDSTGFGRSTPDGPSMETVAHMFAAPSRDVASSLGKYFGVVSSAQFSTKFPPATPTDSEAGHARSARTDIPDVEPTLGGGSFRSLSEVRFRTRQPFEISSWVTNIFNLHGTPGGSFRSPGLPRNLRGRRLSSLPSEEVNGSAFSWGRFFGFTLEESTETHPSRPPSPPATHSMWGVWTAQFWTNVWSLWQSFLSDCGRNLQRYTVGSSKP